MVTVGVLTEPFVVRLCRMQSALHFAQRITYSPASCRAISPGYSESEKSNPPGRSSQPPRCRQFSGASLDTGRLRHVVLVDLWRHVDHFVALGQAELADLVDADVIAERREFLLASEYLLRC